MAWAWSSQVVPGRYLTRETDQHGAMYWLGVSNSELGYVGMPHSPDFVADEESIIVGAKAMAAVLLDFLMKH